MIIKVQMWQEWQNRWILIPILDSYVANASIWITLQFA